MRVEAETPSGGAERRPGALLLLCMAQFMLILDIAIVNVALPPISEDLGFSAGNLQLVVTAYALTFGGLLLLGRAAVRPVGTPKYVRLGARSVHARISRMRPRTFCGVSGDLACSARRRRGVGRPGGALAPYEHLPRGRGAQPGSGRVERRSGGRRGCGTFDRGRAHRPRRLALSVPGDRPTRGCGSSGRAPDAAGGPIRSAWGTARLGGRFGGHHRPRGAGLRARTR